MRSFLSWVAVALLGMLAACVTYAEELNRGQRHYQNNEYERALGVLRALEADIDSLSRADRARYAYLRGMTDFRMSLRTDARHWLALARTYEQQAPGSLEESWRERMNDSLKDLDNDVLGGGEALSAGDGGVD
jgi:hypothetical protein